MGFILLVTLLGLPGLGSLAAGLYKARAQWEFLSHADTARGRVVSVQFLHGNDETNFYGVTVEYPVPNVPSRRFTVETNAPGGFPEGSAVDVAYRADRPYDGRIRDFGLLWRDILLFCVCGGLWAAFAAFFLYAALRGARAAEVRR